MSDSQAYEKLTVASDGVTVVKRFEEDEFPVPAIAFEFTSSRDEGVEVVLTDTVPDDIEVEDLGFHPEYGSEYWMIDDESITFERDLDAGESYTTVYGIRATGSDNVEQFLTEPTLEQVDPPLPEEEKPAEDIIPQSDDDVIKEAIAGDGEIPGLEDDEDGDDVETLDLKDPNAPDGPEADDGGESGGTVEVTEGSLIGAIATEIRQQKVSAEDVKLLRQAFELAGQDGGTTVAKVDQIQSDIADLRAYTSSLEEFLDENGTGERIIGDFESQLRTFDDQLSSLQSELEANREQLQSLDGSVDGFTEEIQNISAEMASVRDEIDEVTGTVDAVSEQVDSVTDEMESVTDTVDAVDEEVDDVAERVETMNEDFEEFDSVIEDVESELETLKENVSDGDVDERIEELEDELENLQTWQEQIKTTFGG